MNKKIIFILFLFFTSIAIFAEGLKGIFGIEFGKTSTEVQKAMEEKGWKQIKKEGTGVRFEKKNGTYANLKVSYMDFDFYEDKFYNVRITFPVNTDAEDIVEALDVIRESCQLTRVSEKQDKFYGYDVLVYDYTDPDMNIFSLTFMVKGNSYISSFTLTNSEIAIEAEREESEKKNKLISSDL